MKGETNDQRREGGGELLDAHNYSMLCSNSERFTWQHLALMTLRTRSTSAREGHHQKAPLSHI